MSNSQVVQTLFDEFAPTCKYEAKPVNAYDVKIGPYLICWQNQRYELHCNCNFLKSGAFSDVLKYAVGHWNRDQMNKYLDNLFQAYEDEPDPADEAEQRALDKAYAQSQSGGPWGE